MALVWKGKIYDSRYNTVYIYVRSYKSVFYVNVNRRQGNNSFSIWSQSRKTKADAIKIAKKIYKTGGLPNGNDV